VPAIAVPALQKKIADGRLDPIYLIVGDDVRLAEALVDAIEGTVDAADRPFAVERVYALEGGGSPLDIAASARVMPMLGDRRIVTVLRAEKILKPKRASKAGEADSEGDDVAGGADEPEASGDLTPLEDYVAHPVDSTTLVFVASEIDRSRKFTKKLVERAVVAEVVGMVRKDDRNRAVYDRGAAQRQAQSILRVEGRTVDPAGLSALVDAAGEDINKLRDDIARLILYAGTRTALTADDVDAVTSGDGVVDDWGVVNAIGDGDPARALVEIGRRMDRGDSPHAIVGQLRWWVSNRLVEGAPERAKPAIDAVLRTDRALKSSGGEDRVLLERLVIELTGKRLPPSRGWGARPSR
jgi:DNA polymerase III delta subunit